MLAARLAVTLASARAASTAQLPAGGVLQPPTTQPPANASSACADDASWVGVLTGALDANPILTRCSDWAGIACDDVEMQQTCHVSALDALKVASKCPATCNRCGATTAVPAAALQLEGTFNVTRACPWEPSQEADVMSCEFEFGRQAALSSHVLGYAAAYESGLSEDSFFRCPALGILNGRQTALKSLVWRHCIAVREGEAGSPVSFDELGRRRVLAGSEWPADLAFQHGLPRSPPVVLGRTRFEEQAHTDVKSRGLGGFFESTIWPRPRHCARSAGRPVNNPGRRSWGLKWVSDEMQLEVRPVLKSGSMTIARLLRCLPGNWTQVPAHKHTNYRVIMVLRPVVDRFASAITEVMGRVFTGNCPEGICDYERDGFNWTIAQQSIDTIGWLSLAQRFFHDPAQYSMPPPTMTDLVRAVADDTSCNLLYYAAEHFITQTSLLVQGSDSAQEPLLFTVEELGETVRDTMQSDFMSALFNGLGPARDDEDAHMQVAQCVANDPQVTAKYRASAAHSEWRNDAARNDESLDFVLDFHPNASMMLDGSWCDIENHDALTARNLTTAALSEAIRNDPQTLKTVCDIYAHDVACFGSMLGGKDCHMGDEDTAPAPAAETPPAVPPATNLDESSSQALGTAPFKALVITEEVDPDLEAQLRSYGLQVSTSPPVYTNESCVGLGDFSHSAETGIFKAHHKAWQTVAESGEPALIMEHDATFGNVPAGDARRHVAQEFSKTDGLNFVGFCLLAVSEDRQVPAAHNWNKDVRKTRCMNYRGHPSSTSNDLNSCLDRSRIANPDATCYLPTCATAYILTPQMARWLSQTGACETSGISKGAPVDTWMFDQCFAEGRPGDCRWIDGRPYDKFHPWALPGAMYSPNSRYFGLGLVVQDRGEYVGVHGQQPGRHAARSPRALTLTANFTVKEKPNYVLPSHSTCPFRPHNKIGFGAANVTYSYLDQYQSGALPLAVVESIGHKLGAGWWYTWSGDTIQGVTTPFVAMKMSNDTRVQPETAAAVLGVNEPDCATCVPSNAMAPEEALGVSEGMEKYGLPIGSPGVVAFKFESLNATEGMEWLDQFMTKAKLEGRRIDFIALHLYIRMHMGQNYTSDEQFRERFAPRLETMREVLYSIHRKYGKPLWVTEAACLFMSPEWVQLTPGIDATGAPSVTEVPAYVTNTQVQNATLSLVELLEELPFVHAYNLMNWPYGHRFWGRYGTRTNIWYGDGSLTGLGQAVATRLNSLRWGLQ
jgi:hypothetical protein